MLTMRPNLRAIIPSTVALMSSIGVSMLASSARSHASRSQSRKSPGGGPPALLTRMSGSRASRERRGAALRRRDVARDLTDRSPGARRRSPPPCAAARPRVRATIVTSQPASASACAQPRPSPLLAAQTSARRPAIPRSMASGHLPRGHAALRTSAPHLRTVPIASTRHTATHRTFPGQARDRA